MPTAESRETPPAATEPPTADRRPTMPPLAPPAAGRPEAVHELRRFHLDPPAPGSGDPLADFRSPLPTMLGEGARSAGYPLFLGPTAEGEGVFHLSLPDLLRRAAPAAGELPEGLVPGLERQLRRLAAGRLVGDRAADGAVPVDARGLIEEAGRALAAEGPEAKKEVEDGVLKLLAGVPAGAKLLPLGPEVPLHLLRHAAGSRLGPAREAFLREARSLAEQARSLLAAAETKPAEEAGDALGELGSRFFDPSALSGVVASVASSGAAASALPEGRRQGLEDAAVALEELLADARHPEVILVHDGDHGVAGVEALGEGWRVERADDPCAAAAHRFDREAERVARALRAVRRVRLEAEGGYRPERHDPWLERFDWQAMSRDELLLLSPVVALTSARRLAGSEMVSLSRLLRSGRPVQLLATVAPTTDPGAEDGSDPLATYRFEPAYLGLAHREVLVQQSSSVEPAHLMQGFLRALRAGCAGVHVVAAAGPEAEALGVETAMAAAVASRAHPLFSYDPEAGTTWAERFDFRHNPRPADDWPRHPLEVRGTKGGNEILEIAVTFADLAFLDPAYRRHFHPVPDGVGDDALVPLADQLAQPPDEEDHRVPYVWAVDPDHNLRRVAVSRPLALACRDRLDFWRTLQELAGVRSEYVRRAAEEAREEAEARTRERIVELERQHAEELERLRRESSAEVVDRLTSALLDVDVGELLGPTVPETAAPGAPAAPTAAFAGQSVDQVAAALLQLVGPNLDAEKPPEADEEADERVEKVASELRKLVD